MFRLTKLVATVAFAAFFVAPLAVRAAESKFDIVIGQGKEGPIVTAVMPGGVGSFMKLQKGDRIKTYSYNGETRTVTKITDLEELLAGKPGKYRLTVARSGVPEEIVIAGLVEWREIPTKSDTPKRILVFLPDRSKK